MHDGGNDNHGEYPVSLNSWLSAHLKEPVVAYEQRGAIDCEVQDAVVAAADDDAGGGADELHSLAPLETHHPPDGSEDHSAVRARKHCCKLRSKTWCSQSTHTHGCKLRSKSWCNAVRARKHSCKLRSQNFVRCSQGTQTQSQTVQRNLIQSPEGVSAIEDKHCATVRSKAPT